MRYRKKKLKNKRNINYVYDINGYVNRKQKQGVAKHAFKTTLRALLSNSHQLPQKLDKTLLENFVFLMTNRNKNYF